MRKYLGFDFESGIDQSPVVVLDWRFQKVFSGWCPRERSTEPVWLYRQSGDEGTTQTDPGVSALPFLLPVHLHTTSFEHSYLAPQEARGLFPFLWALSLERGKRNLRNWSITSVSPPSHLPTCFPRYSHGSVCHFIQATVQRSQTEGNPISVYSILCQIVSSSQLFHYRMLSDKIIHFIGYLKEYKIHGSWDFETFN